MSSESVPSQFAHAVVTTAVHCRGCGYNLRGLTAEGVCPECGVTVWTTLRRTVDPDATKLPRLKNPRAVGNGLLWIMCCLLFVGIVIAISILMELTEARPTSPPWLFGLTAPNDLPLLSGLVGLAALWSVFKFKPARGSGPDAAVWRDIWILAGGFIGWFLVSLVLWLDMRGESTISMDSISVSKRVALRLGLAGLAVFILVGLRGVIGAIGLRSRAYRRAQGGRQGLRPMMYAVAGVAMGRVMEFSGHWGWDYVPDLGRIVIVVSLLMLLIGTAYLVVNAWWIRQALRKPPPMLDQLLLPPVPDDTSLDYRD